MQWNDEDSKALIAFKNSIDFDNIKVKEIIKQKLLNNRFIVHVLGNKELEENDSEPEDYFGVNIFPFYLIPDTQSSSANFICYEVNYENLDRYNKSVKLLQVVFHVLCEQKNLKDKETGVARHDLLSALIQDEFNFSNYFGGKLYLVSDVATSTDRDYSVRTLVFEQRTDNNLVRTKNGVPSLSNKEVRV